jgi:hypothetical protein
MKRGAKRLRILSATEEVDGESSSLSDLTLDDGAPWPDNNANDGDTPESDNPGKSANYDNANRT